MKSDSPGNGNCQERIHTYFARFYFTAIFSGFRISVSRL